MHTSETKSVEDNICNKSVIILPKHLFSLMSLTATGTQHDASGAGHHRALVLAVMTTLFVVLGNVT